MIYAWYLTCGTKDGDKNHCHKKASLPSTVSYRQQYTCDELVYVDCNYVNYNEPTVNHYSWTPARTNVINSKGDSLLNYYLLFIIHSIPFQCMANLWRHPDSIYNLNVNHLHCIYSTTLTWPNFTITVYHLHISAAVSNLHQSSQCHMLPSFC